MTCNRNFSVSPCVWLITAAIADTELAQEQVIYERQQTEQERQQTEQERQQAEQERQRAEQAESQLQQVARNLLQTGMTIAQVVQLTGLSQEQVQRLSDAPNP
jgi:predicted transposase YdaD